MCVLSLYPLFLAPSSLSVVIQSQVVNTLNNITISKTAGETTTSVTIPSNGFQTGGGFQVNFVKDANDLSTILAQSGTFNITASDSTSTTSSSNSVTYAFFYPGAIGHDLTCFDHGLYHKNNNNFLWQFDQFESDRLTHDVW
jgi:hypothetical protein